MRNKHFEKSQHKHQKVMGAYYQHLFLYPILHQKKHEFVLHTFRDDLHLLHSKTFHSMHFLKIQQQASLSYKNLPLGYLR